MAGNWFVYEGGEQVGPVDEAELKDRAAAGTLRPETLVLNDSLTQWCAVGEVTDWVFGRAPAGDAVIAESAVAGALPVLGYVQQSSEALTLSPRVFNAVTSTGIWHRLFAVIGYSLAGVFALAAVASSLSLFLGRGTSLPFGLIIFSMIGAFVFFFPAQHLNRAATAARKLKTMRRTVDLEDALAAQHAFWKYAGTIGIVIFVLYFIGFVMHTARY